MGQYYRQALRQDGQIRLFDSQYAHKGNNSWNDYQDYNGLKLMEHSWLKNPFLMAMTKQLYNHSGEVVWCGDYANEPDDFKDISWTSYNEIYKGNKSRVEILPNDGDFDYAHKYLLNITKKVYVDFDLYISKCNSDGWCVHPLSLLTAVGNGRGGGDYYDEYPDAYLVGSWAGDELKVVDEVPAGYELEDVRFIEDSGYDDDRIEEDNEMDNTFELYFSDLTENAQQEILKRAGVKSPEDMNWDVFPITTIEFDNNED